MDELFIGVGPILLGDGFPGTFPQRGFRLTECKSYLNGSIALRYERMRTRGTIVGTMEVEFDLFSASG